MASATCDFTDFPMRKVLEMSKMSHVLSSHPLFAQHSMHRHICLKAPPLHSFESFEAFFM